MQGKIFAESMNLYQDEARILFDYYKRAAEKIVKDEMDLEASIEAARSEITLAGKNKKKGVIITVVFGAAGLVGGILLFPYGFILALGCIKGVLDILKSNKARK